MRRTFVVVAAIVAFLLTSGGCGDDDESAAGDTAVGETVEEFDPAEFCAAMDDVDKAVARLNQIGLQSKDPADLSSTLTILGSELSSVAEVSPPELEETVRSVADAMSEAAVSLDNATGAAGVVDTAAVFGDAINELGDSMDDVGEYRRQNCS